MKSLRVSLILVLLLLLALPAPAQATGAVVERIKLSEEGVFADWAYTDEQGTTTLVNVIAAQFSQRPNNLGAPTRFLSVSILRFDRDGNPLILASGQAEQFDLTVDANLSSARVIGNVLVEDVIAGSQDVPTVIDLTFTATSPMVRVNDFSKFKEVGFIQIAHFRGDSREAQASGNVMAFNENFALGLSSSASIHDTTDGSITITRKP